MLNVLYHIKPPLSRANSPFTKKVPAISGGGNIEYLKTCSFKKLHRCIKSTSAPVFEESPRIPAHPKRRALFRPPSLYKYVFFVKNQRASRNFFDFFVFLERPAASAAHPVQALLSFNRLRFSEAHSLPHLPLTKEKKRGTI